MQTSKQRLCIVTPIFSEKALGGAEKLAREYVDLLKTEFAVTVLTTTAKDYQTWETFYEVGEEFRDGVHIIRFPVEKKRSYFFKYFHKKLIKKKESLSDKEFGKWIEMQGPVVPGLTKYIEENKDQIPVFFFITYLYYTSVIPIQSIKEKSIAALTLHDEPPAYFPQFRKIFTDEIVYSFSTIEEKETYERIFQTKAKKFSVIGVNVEIPVEEKPISRSLHDKPYILYIGRIDAGKGIGELLNYYTNWRKKFPDSPDLLLVGGGNLALDIPDKVYFKGFVSNEEKYNYLQNCLFLVNPSPMESFSVAIMEAWLFQKAVLVNAHCDTMKHHCQRSNGGLYYRDSDSFIQTINYLLMHPSIREKMGQNGNSYVEKNYNKKLIQQKLSKLIQKRITES